MTDLFTAPTPSENTPTEVSFETLVGDGKKFKTPEDLAKAKVESDRFIQQLQGELAGLRQELSTRQTLEQLMDKINSTPRVPDPTSHLSHNQNSSDGDGQNVVKSLTEEDIARLVEQRLTVAEQARLHQANLATVKQSLTESFGADYVTHLKAKAQELGVTEEYLSNLAKEAPKALLKLVGAGEAPKATTPGLFTPPASHTLPNANNKGFAPNGQRKQSWYENLRKSNPTEYWSPTIQNRMHQEALSLGEAFFDV